MGSRRRLPRLRRDPRRISSRRGRVRVRVRVQVRGAPGRLERRHAVRAGRRPITIHRRTLPRAEHRFSDVAAGDAYSAAGRLADTLEGFRDVLEAGGCLYDGSTAGNAVEPSRAARRARPRADSESENVFVDADENVSVDAASGASSGLSAWGAMGVGALAGAVVVAVAWAVNRACGGGGGGGGARKSRRAYAREARATAAAAALRGVWRLVPLGDSTAISRLVPPGTFRSSRISIGVPIGVPIEALRRDRPRPSRVSSRARRSSSNPRLGNAVTPSPSPRRQPDRPSRRASARARARAQSRSRAPNREGTDTRAEEAFRVDIDAPTAWRREWGESDSSGPSAPPGTGLGTSPRGGDDPRAF